MRALIAGSNPLNETIADYLAQRGVDILTVENPADIRTLIGEVGAFTADLAIGYEKVDFALLTEQPGVAPTPIHGGNVYDLNSPDKLALLSRRPKTEPIVILLDYYNESPAAATTLALKEAKHLAENKRRVWFLSRFVRTAGHEAETLYSATRNAGVSFIKFEQLDIAYDDETMLFNIKADDGALVQMIETASVFADGPRGLNDAFAAFAGKLMLRANDDGFVTEDRFYLTKLHTSRKGVYHITKDVAVNDLSGGLDMVLADYNAICAEDPYYSNIVDIDGEKCVLCYSCYRACPHAAMRPDNVARRMRNLSSACQNCGVCASVCPGNAITLLDDDDIPVSVRQTKVLVLACENSASEALEEVLPRLGKLGAKVDVRPISCGGRIGLEDLSAGLRGYDKVMVAVCQDGACRHVDGNKRACRQSGRMTRLLAETGLGEDRIAFTQTSCAMPGVLKDELMAFMRGDAE